VTAPRLLAVSDLHVRHPDNRVLADGLRPLGDDDWLVVAGDVAEEVDDVLATLEGLRSRFARVLWTPGNHELWARRKSPEQVRGVARYERLVEGVRALGVDTPEDPFPLFPGPDGPVVVAPLFLLYDYSFLPDGATTAEEGLAVATRAGIVATDEYVLHPDPYADRAQWCAARVAESRRRLDALDPGLPTVLVNHWPMTRLPTRALRYPEFALWCGTTATADWHVRYRAVAVVYGHLHIPRLLTEDGVPFHEVSLGYPREWRAREERYGTRVADHLPRQVLPAGAPWPVGGPPAPGTARPAR
jgi:3',5'-cyclic AMP phosphodiesterase CpdA